MTIFTFKYIVNAFGRNSTLALVRREFLLHQDNWARHKQASRASLLKNKFKFWTERQHLSKERDTGLRTSQAVSEEDWTSQTICFTGFNNIVEKSGTLALCSTLFPIMKLDLKHKCFHTKSVQPMTNAHKQSIIQ